MTRRAHEPEITQTDGSSSLRLVGEIDLQAEASLSEVLQEAIAANDRVLLDFLAVSFMDSTGLRVILHAIASMNGRGHIVLFHPTAPVQRILENALPQGVRGLEIKTGEGEPNR